MISDRRRTAWLWGLVALALLACGKEAELPEVRFDQERAFRDLTDLVDIGPRPAGSPGAEQARELIRTRLKQAGWLVSENAFVARPPDRTELEMTNLIGIMPGKRDYLILLVTHYDTKKMENFSFVGANDGASGAALLLELARQLSEKELRSTVWLAFCDGKEAFGHEITPQDGLYGSRALASQMGREGTRKKIRALLLVDMVADEDLNLSSDFRYSKRLRDLLHKEARKMGVEEILDLVTKFNLRNDHKPFFDKGVREVFAFVDFQFGGRQSPGRYWHTQQDDLDAVSADSLGTVGELVLRMVERVDRLKH